MHSTASQILSALSRRSIVFYKNEHLLEIENAEPWEIPYHFKALLREHYVFVSESGAYALTNKGRRYLAGFPEID